MANALVELQKLLQLIIYVEYFNDFKAQVKHSNSHNFQNSNSLMIGKLAIIIPKI